MYGHIYYNVARGDPDLVQGFESLPSATVSDAMGRHGAMNGDIRPIFEGAKIVGNALTVLCFPGDNLMIHKAIQMIAPGDVLVVDDGGHDTGCFGHKSACAVKARGGAGTIISGSVRDVALLRRDRLPIFARSITPRSPQKNTAGSINVPVQVGGIVVCPGDIIVADDDGIVVVPLADAARVLDAARGRDIHEAKTATAYSELPLDPAGKKLSIDDLLKGKVVEHHEPVSWGARQLP
jgi:4-hydroxy-4-methyl-2-oxoglutarate aldolase